MLTRIVLCGSIAGLLLASMSWHSGANYQFLLELIVFMSALTGAAITLYPNLITDLHPRGETISPTSEWPGL
jgi:cytochrome bd-type quinol oxidase subunit 2